VSHVGQIKVQSFAAICLWEICQREADHQTPSERTDHPICVASRCLRKDWWLPIRGQLGSEQVISAHLVPRERQ
jgi:hypothetical protein